MDTGANVTLISQSKWPPDWALTSAPGTLSGIRGDNDSLWSAELIIFEGPEGCRAKTRPFMVRVGTPIVLWGRDMLMQWRICLETDF